jgi:hypothetical protein
MITNSRKIKEGDASEDKPKSLGDIAPNKVAIENAKRGIDADEFPNLVINKQITRSNIANCFFDNSLGGYWDADDNGDYRKHGLDAFKRRLKIKGFQDVRPPAAAGEEEADRAKPIDYALTYIEDQQSVAKACPLAGYRKGIQTIGGQTGNAKKFLITEEANLIEPHQGDGSIIENFFAQLFYTDEQLNYFKAWLKISVNQLHQGIIASAPVVCLCSKRGYGKSAFLSLISLIFGGRNADAKESLLNGGKFNDDLSGAETWFLDDVVSPDNHQQRERLASLIKRVAATPYESIEAKNKGRFTAPVWRRLLICTNDGMKDVAVLPPSGDESRKDKLMIFKAHKADATPLKPDSLKNKSDAVMDYQKVIPAIAAFLWDLNKWEIPKEIIPPPHSNRWGFKTYENPEIVEMLSEDQPDTHLHNLIQSIMDPQNKNIGDIEGPSTEFFKSLDDYDSRGVNELKLTARSLAKHFEKLKERFPHIYQIKVTTWRGKKGMKVLHAKNEAWENKYFEEVKEDA